MQASEITVARSRPVARRRPADTVVTHGRRQQPDLRHFVRRPTGLMSWAGRAVRTNISGCGGYSPQAFKQPQIAGSSRPSVI